MPIFVPQHVPHGLNDFARGFFEAAEWLLDDSVDREKTRGWLTSRKLSMHRDCLQFEERFRTPLEIVYADGKDSRKKPYTAYIAGLDFWLSRNGHGRGFFEHKGAATLRPNAASAVARAFEILQDGAEAFGTIDLGVFRGWIS